MKRLNCCKTAAICANCLLRQYSVFIFIEWTIVCMYLNKSFRNEGLVPYHSGFTPWNEIFPLINLNYATHKLAFDKLTTYKLTVNLQCTINGFTIYKYHINKSISMNLFSIKLLSVNVQSTIQQAFGEWEISVYQTDFIFR